MVAALAVSLAAAGAAYAQYKPAAPAPAPVPVPTAGGQASPVQITMPGGPMPGSAADPQAEARRIPRAEAMKMVKEHKAVWIDVRPKDQYDLGHIPGAMNIPLAELNNRFKDLPLHKFLITYCA